MYRVLVPVDRSERRAAAQVRAVLDLPAAGGGLAVTLLHVVGEREDPDDANLERMASATKAGGLLEDGGVAVERRPAAVIRPRRFSRRPTQSTPT